MAPLTTLYPAYVAFCELSKKAPKPRLGEITVQELRAMASERFKKMNLSFPEAIEEDKTVVHNGTELRLNLFRPPGTENDTLPAVIFYHGGGFAIGSKLTHAKIIRDICLRAHVTVVFVDYSLAPEVKYPVIHEESYSALQWVVENADSIKVDGSKLAVFGDSAGGNLAAAISLMAKERGLNDVIKAQILLYPTLAYAHHIYESDKLFGDGKYHLASRDMEFYDKLYGADSNMGKIRFPLLATNEELKGVPPALVITAEADILRDEGEEYARRLIEAGVPTAASRILGTVHTFATVSSETPAYKQALALITNQLNDVFGNQ